VPFSHVVDVTPSKIELLKGATYRPLLTSYIPRLFWKSKPTEQLGNEFGHRYSLMHHTDHQSSLNVPWVTELYANFGFTGLFLGMTLFGAGMAMFSRFLTGMDRTEIGSAVAIAVLVPLSFPESNFSLMVGSILPLLICLWIYFRVAFLLPIPAASAPENMSLKSD